VGGPVLEPAVWPQHHLQPRRLRLKDLLGPVTRVKKKKQTHWIQQVLEPEPTRRWIKNDHFTEMCSGPPRRARI